MLILALAIVLGSLTWLVVKRTGDVDPVVRRAAIACAIACVGVAIALRAGLAPGLFIVAVALIAVWLRARRADGGDGPGDDGPDPPDEPEPDPAPRAGLRPESSLDEDALDQARAEWERELPKRG
jgi:hypothetical protein